VVYIQMRGLPHLFIALEWSVWRHIRCMPTCNRHGGATREHHVEGGGKAVRWGVGAPGWCLPMTTFRMAVPCWAWALVVSMAQIPPENWPSPYLLVLCFPGCTFDSISMCFMYMSCKTMFLQYMWEIGQY
jgi:hypothetical protein